MSDGTIVYHRQGPIGILSLNRPDKLNAMTDVMGDAIAALVPELNADAELRCLLVRGEGRAFSAGGDLDFLEDNGRRAVQENQEAMRAFYAKFLSLGEVAVPTLALLHGRATGAGLCLALACDLRWAAEDALLSANFARVGLTPGMAGSINLPRLIGPARAAELLFTARTVTAGEALSIGLVNGLVPTGELLETGLRLAAEIAANAPLAVRETKALLRASGGLDLADALDAEALAQARCFASADLQEGIAAVRERRAPRFKGA